MSELISILIPAYNAAQTLRDSIGSCFSQTYSNIEIIVLNNGSNDQTSEVIATIPKNDKLTIINEPINLGIAPARNILLRAAKGNYIAWLDADDTMMHDRLAMQMHYMYKHPETDILGTWITTDDYSLPKKKLPLSHHQITTCLWFKNCLIQPSILSKNFYVEEQIFYDETYTNSVEDYEMWYRLKDKKKFANLDDYLTDYHLTKGIELDLKKRFNHFEENLNRLWAKKWADLELNLLDIDKVLFQHFLYNNKLLKRRDVSSLSKTLNALNKKNNDPFFRLITSLHYLRIWKNMQFGQKFLNLHLLLHFKGYIEMKKTYLI